MRFLIKHSQSASRSVVKAATFGFCLAASAAFSIETRAQEPSGGLRKRINTELIAEASAANANLLTRYVPAKDLAIVVEAAGFDQYPAAWRGTNAYQMLNKTTMGAMLEQVFTETIDAIAAQAPAAPPFRGADFVSVVEFAHRSGYIFAINDDGKPRPQTPQSMIFVARGAAGKNAPTIVRQMLAPFLGSIPGGPPKVDRAGGRKITMLTQEPNNVTAIWNENDDLVFIKASDAKAIDDVIETIDGRSPNVSAAPFYKKLVAREHGFQPMIVAGIDLTSISGQFPENAKKLGAEDLKTIGIRWGFQDNALLTIVGVETNNPRTGLAALLNQKTFDSKTLPAIPKEAITFVVGSFHLDKAITAIETTARPIAGDEVDNVMKLVDMANRFAGIDIRKDLLARLGSKTTFIQLPSRFGVSGDILSLAAGVWLHVPKTAIVIETDEPREVEATIDRLVVSLNALFAKRAEKANGAASQPGLLRRADAPSKPIKAEFRPLKGSTKGYVLIVPPGVMPLPAGLKPTIAIGEKSLVLATSPDSAERVVTAQRNPDERWKPTGDLTKIFEKIPEDLVFLSFNDPRETPFPELISNVPALTQALGMFITEMNAQQKRGGMNARPGGLPGAPGGGPLAARRGPEFRLRVQPETIPDSEELRKYFFPGFVAAQVHDHEFRIVIREAFPNINPGNISISSTPVMIALLLPAVQSAREAARRAQCTNNLKQIGLAMMNYESANGNLPASATVDAAGKPLLSWRVMILPYIDQGPLYDKFKLDEPWDSPNNKQLIPYMPITYACPSDAALLTTSKGLTKYRVCESKGTMFEGKKSWKLADIVDGTSNTIAVFESSQETIWTKPDEPDIELEQLQKIKTMLGSKHPGGINAMFGDGSVRFIKSSVDGSILKALFTRGGGEIVRSDAL